MKLAVCQIKTEIDQDETLRRAEGMIREATENGAEIIALPEMFACPYSRKYFKAYAALGHEKTLSAMKRWAKENDILLIGGSVPETEDGKVYNTCFVIDGNGAVIARHRKIHLFEIDVPGMRFSEAASFEPGRDITVFDSKWGKIGVAVCFDVHFPELFRAMAVRGARLVILPAQFDAVMGALHWKSLLRCRADDNQIFFAGVSAARNEAFSYKALGDSMVIDPYGQIIAECDEKEHILYADIDLDMVDEARKRLPVFNHLRRDVYTVAE